MRRKHESCISTERLGSVSSAQDIPRNELPGSAGFLVRTDLTVTRSGQSARAVHSVRMCAQDCVSSSPCAEPAYTAPFRARQSTGDDMKWLDSRPGGPHLGPHNSVRGLPTNARG